MSEQFAYQCQYCGTSYNHPQAECPYCGEPQYFTDEELEAYAATQQEYATSLEESVEQDYYDDDPYAVQGYETDDAAYDTQHYQENYHPQEEAYVDELYTAASQGDLARPYADDYTDEAYPTEQEYYDDRPSYANDRYLEYPDEYEDYPQGEYGVPLEAMTEEPEPAPSRFTFRRFALGCVGLLVCIGLFYGGVGLLAIRQGLQERAVMVEDESNEHYDKGLAHLANNELDLAIAEFELARSINPTNSEIRDALRDTQQLVESQPTATSETRSAAAAELLAQAEAEVDDENWADAVALLTDIRGLDAQYQAAEISDLIFEANYQLGLQYIQEKQIEDAQLAFEQALIERPDDPEATVANTKALLYLEGLLVEPVDAEQAVEIFSQLYDDDKNYADVEQRYQEALEQYGDDLFEENEWCQAEVHYLEALELEPSRLLETKIDNVSERCEEDALTQRDTPEAEADTDDDAAPAAALIRPTATSASSSSAVATTEPDSTTDLAEPTEEATTEPTEEPAPVADTSLGSVVYSKYNPAEKQWEIVSIPAAGGPLNVLVTDGQMPSISPDGTLLLYRTDLPDSVGLHLYNLTTGEDNRITIYQEHISPKWGPGSTDYIFSAQEPGTGRWQIYQGFADGKGDPNILGDGRTPAWSPKGDLIAYQGTDPQGNNPGIYVRPFGGGDAVRVSTHESDRSPAFSPNGSQVAYMSTSNGKWDIFVVSASGGTPNQVTNSVANDGLPAWSPDGSQIAYVSDSGGGWGIHRVSAQGGSPTRITDWDGFRQEDWLMAQIWWSR